MYESVRRETMPISKTYSGTSDALYRVHFFGPFRVKRNNQPIGEPIWRRNKAKALLKWFLLNPGRMFSASQLIKNFWPEADKMSAERNLHVAIHYLRHLLEPDLAPRQESRYIRRNKDNFYWFELDETWWADIFDVQHHYTSAKEAEQRDEVEEAIMHYRQIVSYCSLEFLHEDAYEDTFSSHRRHYERIYTEVLERLMHLHSHIGKPDEALTYAHHALLVDPYCEAAVKAIVHAYLHKGNVAGAIYKLDAFQTFLREDLGIEPGDDMLALRQKIIEIK